MNAESDGCSPLIPGGLTIPCYIMMLHGKKLVVQARDIIAGEIKLSSIYRTCPFEWLEWLFILKIHSFHEIERIKYCSGPQICPPSPPFATLPLVQSAGGACLYVGCDIFSRNYALPSGAPPTTSCPNRRQRIYFDDFADWKDVIHVAVPCRNRRLFRHLFRSHCCAISLKFR